MSLDWNLALLKREWEDAERASRYARDVAAQAFEDLRTGAAREPLPELTATAKELQVLAAERRRTYLEALAKDLMCMQQQEHQRRSQ